MFNLFGVNEVLQTLLLVLGFLSLANIAVNIWLGAEGRHLQHPAPAPAPQARMLDTVATVFDAINTMETKYFDSKY